MANRRLNSKEMMLTTKNIKKAESDIVITKKQLKIAEMRDKLLPLEQELSTIISKSNIDGLVNKIDNLKKQIMFTKKLIRDGVNAKKQN